MVRAAGIPAIRAERCIIYCLNCGRFTNAATFVVEGLFGWLPYGRVTGRLHCKTGCGDRFGMVLPMDAPTPRIFVQKYDLEPAPQKQDHAYKDIEGEMQFRLLEVGQGGTFLRVHAKAIDNAILHWGFDYLLKQYSDGGHKPPRFAVTWGATWSRDSARDYKVVVGNVTHLPQADKDGKT